MHQPKAFESPYKIKATWSDIPEAPVSTIRTIRFKIPPISNLQDSILKHAAGICKELGPSIAAATQTSSEACGNPGKSPKADRGETQHCLATADQQDPLLTRPH